MPARSTPSPQDADALRRENNALLAEIAALREMAERLWLVLRNAPIVLFAMDNEGRFTLSEGAGLETLGLAPGEAVGKSAFEMYRDAPQVVANIRRCLSGEPINEVVAVGDHTFKTRYLPRLDDGGRVVGVDGIAWDVTGRIRAEESAREFQTQLMQAQKIETIGTLAGGIAHDFNNILSPILGYTDIAMDMLEADHPAREDLQQVLNAAGRARELVQQILIFARRGDQKKRPLQLHLVVQEALKLIRATLPSTIEISQRIANRNDSVVADPGQMHQIMMNLCTNAAYAMRDAGGVLRVELDRRTLGVDDVASIPGISAGDFVVLTVADTGRGMSADIRNRAFEPFFTTKPPGEGTGLGLSMVHGIVLSHGGAVAIESEPGKGTSVRVFLPAVGVETPAVSRDALGVTASGGEHVMVVDDEPDIVRMLTRMLESRGYRVSAFASGEEALAAFRAAPDGFDAIITDQTMPRVTGLALAHEVRTRRPSMPVIITTGYGEQVTSEMLARDVAGFAAKPFDAATLITTLRRAIASRPAS